MFVDLDLDEDTITAGAAVFAQLSYREHEFGHSTDILFRHGDADTRLHFLLAIAALAAVADGKTWRDLDEQAPFFPAEH